MQQLVRNGTGWLFSLRAGETSTGKRKRHSGRFWINASYKKGINPFFPLYKKASNRERTEKMDKMDTPNARAIQSFIDQLSEELADIGQVVDFREIDIEQIPGIDLKLQDVNIETVELPSDALDIKGIDAALLETADIEDAIRIQPFPDELKIEPFDISRL